MVNCKSIMLRQEKFISAREKANWLFAWACIWLCQSHQRCNIAGSKTINSGKIHLAELGCCEFFVNVGRTWNGVRLHSNNRAHIVASREYLDIQWNTSGELSHSIAVQSNPLGATSYSYSSFNSRLNASMKAVAVGAGSWGTAVARLLAKNVQLLENWENDVIIQVYDELISDVPPSAKVEVPLMLSSCINAIHMNPKYLPNVELPHNLFAVTAMDDVLKNADLIVFGVPNQFVHSVLKEMKGKVKNGAYVVTLTKGVEFVDGKLKLISQIISEELGIPDDKVCILSGGNIAHEVANERFSEATLACKNEKDIDLLRPLFHSETFHVTGITNTDGPQMCGALKNIIALGKGLLDGLQKHEICEVGCNMQAAFIRISLQEIKKFTNKFFNVPDSVFFESCCLGDILATCMGGRHQRVAEAYVLKKGMVSFVDLEKEMLNGQKLQGTSTAKDVYSVIKKMNLEGEYPIMTTIYRIIYENLSPVSLCDAMKRSK